MGVLMLAAEFGSEIVGIGPVREALGFGAHERVHVVEVEARHDVVVRRGDHADAVGCDVQLDVLDPVVGTRLGFRVLDRTGSVRDVGLTVAEPSEPVAGSRS